MPELTKEESDAGKRAADAVNIHRSAIGDDAVNKWVAVNLSDGSSDGVLYFSQSDAVSHQSNEFTCAYVCIPPELADPYEMGIYMRTVRQLYDKGFRLTDPRNDPRGMIRRPL
jgi:hypothetical protein